MLVGSCFYLEKQRDRDLWQPAQVGLAFSQTYLCGVLRLGPALCLYQQLENGLKQAPAAQVNPRLLNRVVQLRQ
jgi:hypothetical protein